VTTSADCLHETLEFSPQVNVIQEPAFLFAAVSVRCAACHQQFHWRGLTSGHPNPNEPVVSADGFELRAPIAPGPGAVVGLLDKTGLIDKLVQPPNGAA
jgi:hypothetical protein